MVHSSVSQGKTSTQCALKWKTSWATTQAPLKEALKEALREALREGVWLCLTGINIDEFVESLMFMKSRAHPLDIVGRTVPTAFRVLTRC